MLVTGSKGFIGKNLVESLEDDIYSIDIGNRNHIFSNNFKWNKINGIYHLGAISNTTETDFSNLYNFNIDYSIKLFEKAIEYQIPIVYASSASVYGEDTRNNKIQPLNYYACSKAYVDQWVMNNIGKFSYVMGARFFNVYGNHEEHKLGQASPITTFSLQAKDTGQINVFEGSEHIYRDFVSVQDVVKCITKLLPNESGIYDVGTSDPISFMDVAETICKKYNSKINIIEFPQHLKGKYQNYTCAKKRFSNDFIRVQEFVESL
jgi:ADP-L-glycero-D-manno-heptose 6-epimerase